MASVTDYDKFAIGWREFKRSGLNYAHQYLEKPAMLAKLPDLTGKRVLSLGCGTGEECATLLNRGAAHIIAIDLSETMLALARSNFESDPRVKFIRMDM